MTDNIKVDILYGSVALETRWRVDGRRLYGQSRKVQRDRDERVVSVSEWEETGAVMWLSAPAPRKWWQFWRRKA